MIENNVYQTLCKICDFTKFFQNVFFILTLWKVCCLPQKCTLPGVCQDKFHSSHTVLTAARAASFPRGERRISSVHHETEPDRSVDPRWDQPSYKGTPTCAHTGLLGFTSASVPCCTPEHSCLAGDHHTSSSCGYPEYSHLVKQGFIGPLWAPAACPLSLFL